MPSASSKQAAQTPNTETSDAVRQVIAVVEKKIRNLEKRKVKLDGYKVMVTEGQELNKDQLDALAKYDEVASNVEFAKELIKHFQTILQDAVKQQKRTAKREHIQRLEAQQKSVRSILELQDLLDQLGNENVRNDFIKGDHGAVTLSEEQLNHLDEFYKLVSPTREEGKQEGSKQKFSDHVTSSSDHLVSFLEARPKAVCETTYKELKETVDKIIGCGYLENIPTHSENGDTEPEKEEVAVETIEGDEYVVVESEEVPEAGAPEIMSSLPPELPTVMMEEPVMPPSTNGPLLSESVIVKPHRDVTEVLASVQGDFNFMQESMIDFQSPHMDPAVVEYATSQPMLSQSTQSAIPQQSQLDPTHSVSAQLEQITRSASLDKLTQSSSALETAMLTSTLSAQECLVSQEQYTNAASSTDHSSLQQHSTLAQSLASTQTHTTQSQSISQTLPSQSMTGASQMSEQSQLGESLSSQLTSHSASVQTVTSMASQDTDLSQGMALTHEQSQQQQTQEQTQPPPKMSSQINVNAPPFQSMTYMRQQQQQLPTYEQQAAAQVVTSQPQQLEYADPNMGQAEYFNQQQQGLQDNQHEQQMTTQTGEPLSAPGGYPHQHTGMQQHYQRGGSPSGRGNGRGGRGTRGMGNNSYRGSGRPFTRGGYSSYQPRDYQSAYPPQDRSQYGGYPQGGGYKGRGGVPSRGVPQRGRGNGSRGNNGGRGRGGFSKPPNQPSPVSA